MLALLLLSVQSPTPVPCPRPGEDSYAPRGYKYFARGLADVGDLDGDGLDEFTVSDPDGSNPATVWILSGADAHIFDRLSSSDCNVEFGSEVARVPDVDLDGVDEIAVAAPPGWRSGAPGLVILYSGRTRAVLQRIVAPRGVEHFGYDIAGLADIDGDGSGDLLANSTHSSSERCGFLFSGKTGAPLREMWCPARMQTPHVFPIGDVDGDGWADVALTGTEKGSRVPVALLISCRDGRSLGELRGSEEDVDKVVTALALGGESGRPSMLLWSILQEEEFSTERSQRLYSLRTRQPWSGTGGFGLIGDVDGDGVPDFVLTWPDDGGLGLGTASCYSGCTGKLLWSTPTSYRWRDVELFHMGQQLAVIGDFDRDGVRDFIWGTSNAMNSNPGLVFISSGKTGQALEVLARGPNLEILRLGLEG